MQNLGNVYICGSLFVMSRTDAQNGLDMVFKNQFIRPNQKQLRCVYTITVPDSFPYGDVTHLFLVTVPFRNAIFREFLATERSCFAQLPKVIHSVSDSCYATFTLYRIAFYIQKAILYSVNVAYIRPLAGVEPAALRFRWSVLTKQAIESGCRALTTISRILYILGYCRVKVWAKIRISLASYPIE